ncbi:LLM class flavin-dependent oxidoreductase [Pseudonocardia sp. NPDC049154]|uniref:LLM class flavin-dependent oxidoreductase n=1 Tax=Pseudonocardia sp. NPDC049154 TaxID=3155501 RepID=UPI0033C39837
MKVTYQMFFANVTDLPDDEFYRQELRLAELAEPLGFDGIWCVEHHFDGEYSMCPDNLMVLAHLAARTERITLTTGGVILPWNDPLRVAEKITLLDTISGGRAQLGVGRGLSKIEYDTFGIEMGEARDRFDQSFAIVLDALRAGTVRANGPLYHQPEADLRPRPRAGLAETAVSIAMSDDSRAAAADVGVAIASFAQFPTEEHARVIGEYRKRFEDKHGRPAPPPVMTDHIYCAADEEEATRLSREHIIRHFMLTMRHYSFDKAGHFDSIKGYTSYAAMADAMQQAGKQAAADGYVAAQITGTPEQIVARIKERIEAFGDYDQNFGFSYGGLPHHKIESSMRLFASEVLPELDRLGIRATVAV